MLQLQLGDLTNGNIDHTHLLNLLNVTSNFAVGSKVSGSLVIPRDRYFLYIVIRWWWWWLLVRR
jgi:hypothetical protein